MRLLEAAKAIRHSELAVQLLHLPAVQAGGCLALTQHCEGRGIGWRRCGVTARHASGGA